MGDERRTNERYRVCGGNADIESVIGRGKKPAERARILNWSRGGLLLKVKSPRRRFLVAKAEPVLWEDDSLTCTLRLPPTYKEIFVTGDVVHVCRASDDPEWLEVGLAFDTDHTPPAKLEALAKMLEPKARSVSGRMARARSARHQQVSDRLGPASDEAEVRKQSKRVKRTSQRAAKSASARHRSSQRVKQRSSQRIEQSS